MAACQLRPIRPGDTIAIVSPASPIIPDRLDAITALLKGDGYLTKVFPHALQTGEYLAGTDEQRAEDLQSAFDDPEVAAVLCSRGGYGCARLLEHLDFDRIAASKKALFGFSDITTLHLALNRRGVPSVHSPMALTLHYKREEWVYESFRRVLRGDLTIPEDAQAGQTVVGGVAEGELMGGCLCLICDSIGTYDEIQTEGRIILIEDVDEAPHRVDAMLTHLRNSGLIQKAAGILMGEMTRSDEKVDDWIGGLPWREIAKDRLGDLGVPFVIDFPMGHAKNMLTLPLGVRVRLDADAGTITYLDKLFTE